MNQAHQTIALRIPRAFVLDEVSGSPSLRGLGAVATSHESKLGRGVPRPSTVQIRSFDAAAFGLRERRHCNEAVRSIIGSGRKTALEEMVIFKIRPEQIQTFEQQSRERFELFMAGHLDQFFPDHCRALGKDGVRKAIAIGIEKASHYGIVSERDVCKFTDLMFAFGEMFDNDPKLPWAAAILTDVRIANPSTRTNRLCDKAHAYLAWLKKKNGSL